MINHIVEVIAIPFHSNLLPVQIQLTHPFIDLGKPDAANVTGIIKNGGIAYCPCKAPDGLILRVTEIYQLLHFPFEHTPVHMPECHVPGGIQGNKTFRQG